MTTPSSSVREEIARIIDPEAWVDADRSAGKPKSTGGLYRPADQWAKTQPSLAKADAILAFLSPGDGERQALADRLVAEAAALFIREGLRLTPAGLIVREKADKSDPHFALCKALEAREEALRNPSPAQGENTELVEALKAAGAISVETWPGRAFLTLRFAGAAEANAAHDAIITAVRP